MVALPLLYSARESAQRCQMVSPLPDLPQIELERFHSEGGAENTCSHDSLPLHLSCSSLSASLPRPSTGAWSRIDSSVAPLSPSRSLSVPHSPTEIQAMHLPRDAIMGDGFCGEEVLSCARTYSSNSRGRWRHTSSMIVPSSHSSSTRCRPSPAPERPPHKVGTVGPLQQPCCIAPE